MADTGGGATLTLGTTGSVGTIRSIQCPTFELEALDVNDLADTTWMKKIPADLADPGEISAEIYFDGDGPWPSLGVVETVTITFPKVVATNTAATLAASGFISSMEGPNLVNNELQMATLTITLDGGEGGTTPTFTAEA